MAPLDLQSELFSATGGAAAEGVSNQLGRPRADRFTLMVREAVQNSWDARIQSAGGVHFQLDGHLLGDDLRQTLTEKIFASAPTSIDIRSRLLGKESFPILTVSDFGTRGLGGPTRGDVVPLPGEHTNFVDFMRYIGRPPNRAHAGGTYGFGKAAYFLASSLKTICVHTRFAEGSGTQSRFMAAALGPQFESEGPEAQRFTGRHWWGRLAADAVVDPLQGDEADAVALLLGGPQRNGHASGTTIYILAPDFGDITLFQALEDMARAIADHFWPKLIDGPDQGPTMSFEVRCEGQALPLPSASTEPDLALLSRAFAAVLTAAPPVDVVLESIASQRPKKLLGKLALVRKPSALMGSKSAVEENENESGRLYQRGLRRPLHHIAIMRAPNFVVKYIEGPLVPYALAEYAGVFRVDTDADIAFARAEPPTHDDWIPDLLVDASEKTYVRVALRRVKERVEAFAAPHAVQATGEGNYPTAAFSRLLGGLVPSLGSSAGSTESANTSTSTKGGSAERGSNARKGRELPQISIVGEPSIELIDGNPAMVVRFEARGADGSVARVFATPKVVIADGFESDPPEGAQQPAVLHWAPPQGSKVSAGSPSHHVPVNSGTWSVAVSIPPDAMISVAFKVESGAHE